MAQPWREGQGLCQGVDLSCKQAEVIQDWFFRVWTFRKFGPNPPTQSQSGQKIKTKDSIDIKWVEKHSYVGKNIKERKGDKRGMEDGFPSSSQKDHISIWQFPSRPRFFSQLCHFKKEAIEPLRVVSYEMISQSKIDDPPDPADRLPHTSIYEIDY